MVAHGSEDHSRNGIVGLFESGCLDRFYCTTYFRIYEKNRWEETDEEYPTNIPRCLDRASACTVEDKIYFIGGMSIILHYHTYTSKF